MSPPPWRHCPVPCNGEPAAVSAEHESAILNFIIDRLQIDDDWFEWTGRGFRWWAGPLAQRIAFSARRNLHGVPISTLHVETDSSPTQR